MRYEKIQPRDLEALAHLYNHRYLTGELFKDLPLVSGDFPSQQVANARIRRLIEYGYIKPFGVQGINNRILAITKNALQPIADWYQTDVSKLEWVKNRKHPKGAFFLNHFLLNNKFRITVQRACRGSSIELLDYIPEHIGTRHESGRIVANLRDCVDDVVMGFGQVCDCPDAVMALKKGDKTALFFVEIDRNTERQYHNPASRINKKIRFYMGYMKTGRYRAYDEAFQASFSHFRVLFVTASDKRLQSMRQKLSVIPDVHTNSKRFFWLTVFNEKSDVREFAADFFSSRWSSLDVEDSIDYSIA